MLLSLNTLRKKAEMPCNIPPLRIVFATHDYSPRSSKGISFRTGDLFHVIGIPNPEEYQVCNPLTNAVGLAPARLFETINKSTRSGQVSPLPLSPARSRASSDTHLQSPPEQCDSDRVGVAKYSFSHERDDELSFEEGQSLVVVARSTQDWLVARPQDGARFGLVPASYLDCNLDGLPSVQEWKQARVPALVPSSPGEPSSNASVVSNEDAHNDTAHVTAFFHNETEYVFTIVLRFESVGTQRTLYRTYDNFYSMHVQLLSMFPKEAGRTGERRVLPFMPAPLDVVTEDLTSQRRGDLDLYIQQLFLLPTHIQHSAPFREFFTTQKSDFESCLSSVEPLSQKSQGIRVKVMFRSEIFAFKLPVTSTNFDLQQKICERFGDEICDLHYRNDFGQLQPLDLSVPLDKISTTQSGKLLIYAE
ncbi:bud emergence protein 1 [Entomophthora muscae]|uniref:Bud emergence protein 1 n=1 Tax=Entomophthora muscae TaxID=34485 RepID=A0ACC2RNR2_9FUNG|nr:bud emergence protein 1 [Entomophthora muscae]